MSAAAQRLAELLPAVYRRRDDDGALRELLDVVADQVTVLEQSLERLHDDLFVETCEPWVLPYIGDLLGIVGLPPPPLTPRAEVAHTIAYRRRKGTAAVLERLGRDIGDRPARAVEHFELLAATQHLNHLRPRCQAQLEIRDALRLERLGGPFECLPDVPTIAHSVDVRRIASGRGRYNIGNVGVFLWRLLAQPLSRSPAVPDGAGERRRFRFSPLGCDAPLFNRPRTEDEPTHLALPGEVPDPISRRAAAADLASFYGEGRSILVEAGGHRLAPEELTVCDLGDWRPPAGAVAIDPVLGRIAFPGDVEAPLVSCHFGFGAEIGAAAGARPFATAGAGTAVERVAGGTRTIQAAIDALPPAGGVVEIGDSGRYLEPGLTIEARGRTVVLRAAAPARPTLVLGDELRVGGDAEGSVVLDGLLAIGSAVEVAPGPEGGDLGRLELNRTTLVPGRALAGDGTALSAEPSLLVGTATTAVRVERSIVGSIRAGRDARVEVLDSIVDATARSAVAFSAPDGGFGATLALEQTTVIGAVRAAALELVSNSILLAEPGLDGGAGEWPAVVAQRTQEGCVRFSWLPPGARAPRRYRCPPAERPDAAPVFVSTRYGDPSYCLLADFGSSLIGAGADDEGELGAFHHTHLSRREAHLRARLDEHLRFGLEGGLLHAT